MRTLHRVGRKAVAMETTLLAHGVPCEEAMPLALRLARIASDIGASPAVVGVLRGEAIVGMTDDELAQMFATEDVEKANTGNLGVLAHRGATAATTASGTMELAHAAGVRVFATGGLGGVHSGWSLAGNLDVSADLAALARFPLAVVCSGVKAILDVVSTREALETLGVPVVGWRTEHFPAFYMAESGVSVDAVFDDARDLAAFARDELHRTGRAVVVANPPPVEHAIAPADWHNWLAAAASRVDATGRDRTPALLAALHAVSGGATLRTNLALVESNVALAAQIAVEMDRE